MSENLLTVSARDGFICHFQSPHGVSALVAILSDHLNARLTEFFWGDLACTSVPCDDRGSEIFGGTALLRPGESAT